MRNPLTNHGQRDFYIMNVLNYRMNHSNSGLLKNSAYIYIQNSMRVVYLIKRISMIKNMP